ncbi:MAG TPA: hypothetical protein VME47_02110 [Acetobacteraceae bacterium]|nr:hypothetical protein [Acetobacteraceae bacterium]
MIDPLHGLDGRTALGVLARAALSLSGTENPASQTVLGNESAIRREVLAAARRRIGLAADDTSPAALEQIGDVPDEEAERLAGPPNVDAALRRLAEQGALPSDMYEVAIFPTVSEWLGTKFELELELIKATICNPIREQHFGPAESPRQLSLVSLFYKEFKTKWPFKDFGMLVVGHRNGLLLTVVQGWRIYPSQLNVSGSSDLVGLLQKFANEYGEPIEWEGRRSSFFLSVDKALPGMAYKIANKPHMKIGISQIVHNKDGIISAALVVAVDIHRYRDMLDRMAVAPAEMLGDWRAKPVERTAS